MRNEIQKACTGFIKALIGFLAMLSGMKAWVHNGVGQNSVAAATAVLGYDLASNTFWQQNGVDRALTGVALKGSAAANDTKIDLFIDTVKVGEFYNGNTGFPNMDDLIPIDAFVPANSLIHAYITDAPATNPINIMLAWDEL